MFRQIEVMIILVVLCAWFWSCDAGSIIHVSQNSTTWDAANSSGQSLLNYTYIKQNGWENILGAIPEDGEFWIAAVATQTQFVSWEGCARFLNDTNSKPECKDMDTVRGGSISDCLQTCNADLMALYILLKGEKCHCLKKSAFELCFVRTHINHCQHKCTNNLNDRCGGTEETFASVYVKVKSSLNIKQDNATSSRNQDCLRVTMTKSSTSIFSTASCFVNNTRGYICNESLDYKDGDYLSWTQAFEKCGGKSAHLGYKMVPDGFSYWTSLRRSLKISWIPLDNKNHDCVTIKKDSVPQLILQTDNCTGSHRYLYTQQDGTDTSTEVVNTADEENGIKKYIWQIVVLGILPGCVIMISLICYCTGLKCKKQQKSSCQETVQIIEDQSVPPETLCRHNSSVTLNRNTDSSMSEQPQNVYNRLGSVQNPNTPIYDTTLTNRQPLLGSCPENEHGFRIQTKCKEDPKMDEEGTRTTYVVQKKKGKDVPRILSKTNATYNAYFPTESVKVPAINEDISSFREDDQTNACAVSTDDCSENIKIDTNRKGSCKPQENLNFFLVSKVEEDVENNFYYKLEAVN